MDPYDIPISSKWDPNKKVELYDMVVKIENLLDIKTGWPISYPYYDYYEKTSQNPGGIFAPIKSFAAPSNEKMCETKKKLLNDLNQGKRKAIVCALGLYNKGKSYVLSRLFGLNLNSSYYQHTEGLSVVSSRSTMSDVLIGLDTQGSQKPVKPPYTIRDSEATERFLQELALHLSDVVLIVVDRLTRDDQSYIKQVKQKYSLIAGKNASNVIIVHNLSHVRTVEKLKTVIVEEVETIFNAVRSENLSCKCHYWTNKDDGTRHVVIAQDENKLDGTPESRAGQISNVPTFSLLKEWVQSIAAIQKESGDLVNNVIESSNKLIKYYIDHPNLKLCRSVDKKNIVISPPLQNETLSYCPNIRFNMVGIIDEVNNTQPSIVKEDNTHYHIYVDCTGYDLNDLAMTIEEISDSKKIKIVSTKPRSFSPNGDDDNDEGKTIVHDDFKFNQNKLMEWSYIFPHIVVETSSSKDIHFVHNNGILYIKLTKKSKEEKIRFVKTPK
ncbi:hypothetical protein DDB_G0284527 [Dictyostelium discoideum AX4]|uniref:Guanylate-binding protein N-terminal domain-containing protein n=1 Tax=Dictyostelium discoideum TaxID=44689 RepID=Q54PI3_DICDI|nr:hypothetical protein DDB_G0284527 [Dictyostelium discoideum AX4]EAL65190.1 hypothetical protein DDB_G0284527 [Dictyostelium discoideum AX4]|eukprot:XP_638549.1 hypothetical protein DDB_G0284527 [Dictyostelium discoideum AX4]